MDLRDKTIVADLTWMGAQFIAGLGIKIDSSGRIESVLPSPPGADDPFGQPPDLTRLRRRALLPGFVNAHSHAFQRGLRGTPQRFEVGSGNFWSWRETMYRLAGSLDVDAFYEQSRLAFTEMLRAGFTSVGEFHYLHHAGDDCSDWAFDDAIIAAAREVGIRLVLIQCHYATGGIGRPLEGAQRRFGPVSRDAFLRQLDHLGGLIDASRQSLALACHSVRAVDLDDLSDFRDAAAANGWAFHIHVEEVRGEIDDSLARHGRRPMSVLLDTIAIDPAVTAIHCTHSDAGDLTEFVRRGGGVCLCPITEGNLSDGFADLPLLRGLGARLAIGTDCNIRISATEELRWLEFGQRLRREQRGIVVDSLGSSVAGLLHIGTAGGAGALQLNAGEIAPGRFADLVAIDLDDPDLRGVATDALADALVFGCGNEPVDRVWVGGKQVV